MLDGVTAQRQPRTSIRRRALLAAQSHALFVGRELKTVSRAENRRGRAIFSSTCALPAASGRRQAAYEGLTVRKSASGRYAGTGTHDASGFTATEDPYMDSNPAVISSAQAILPGNRSEVLIYSGLWKVGGGEEKAFENV